ncbi:MAG: hypothetical protein ACXWQ5_16120, partial [Ktedonobacterales bacterium]
MAENGDGLRSDSTQVGTEQLKPHPNNENVASTPEQNGVEPRASASEQAAGDGAGVQMQSGEAPAALSAAQDAGAGI